MKKNLVIGLIALALSAYFIFDLQRYLNVVFFQDLYADHPRATAAIYFLVYVTATAFSLPTGALLTLAGGAVFGLTTGVVLVSFASTVGATIAFLFSRIVLRDWVQKKFAHYLEPINRGVEKDGAFYLFGLRLIPVFPFWVINLLTGLTPLKVRTYFWVSQLGMLPATVVYTNAGAELAAIEELSPAGILTPGLIGSFVLLAILPFFARALVGGLKHRRVYRPYSRPKRFDANLLIIGGGSAGLVSALIGAAVKAKVMLVEKDKMGGDCLNTGCVPSKALIRAARVIAEAGKAGELGVDVAKPKVDFPRVMARVHSVIDTIAPHDSVERFTGLGVDCIEGEARLLSPWQAQVGERTISARNIVIATGARPFVPPIPGLDEIDYLTSENLWEIKELPPTLMVLGAGPIGCELAQAFQRLGSKVSLVDMLPTVLPKEDPDVSSLVRTRLEAEGVEVLLNYRTAAFQSENGAHRATLESTSEQPETSKVVNFDKLLVAVGRKANTSGLGLEELGIECTPQGTLEVDDYLRTTFPNVYACGDVAGPYQFTHTASHQAWYAVVNALFGRFRKFSVDYRVIPWTTFTDPEVARVGLNETEARERDIAYELSVFPLSELDRAIADGASDGFIKVLTVPGKDRILGATVVGAHAGELLAEFVTAMKHNLGLNKILGTIHAYPTYSDANKLAAGGWKRSHAPARVLSWLEKYHRWHL